ncbi:MAG TPA: hypothetical protein VNF07_02520 [Acidimicrobiales bacterium]|nr:hypothetical protein [Acidimicrobiales bacterium]
MVDEQLSNLLVEALETERGEVSIYETALRCAVDVGLRSAWQDQAEVASRHAEIVEGAVAEVGVDSSVRTTTSAAVHYIEATLVHAMEMALESAPPGTAELVALECVSFAEARDRLNWERLSDAVNRIDGEAGAALKAVSAEITGAAPTTRPAVAGFGQKAGAPARERATFRRAG